MTIEVLDQRMVNALRDFGDEPGQLLDDMLHEFLVEGPSLVTEIEGAVEEAAYGVVARAAHRLRGIGGHIGAARLADSASEVEIAARTGSRRSTTAATVIMRAELTLAATAASSLLRS